MIPPLQSDSDHGPSSGIIDVFCFRPTQDFAGLFNWEAAEDYRLRVVLTTDKHVCSSC